MKIDPNRYLRTLSPCRDQILRSHDVERTLSEISSGTHVPMIAAVHYAMRPDVLGPTDALLAKARMLVEFYGYTEVAPWEDLRLTQGGPLVVEDLDLSGIGLYLERDPGVPGDDYFDSGYTSLGRTLWARHSDEGKKRHTFTDTEVKLHSLIAKNTKAPPDSV
jgi:hypothetical protein